MRHKICDVKVGDRFRKDMGNLSSLKKSIQEIGLLHPIVVDSENGSAIINKDTLQDMHRILQTILSITHSFIQYQLRICPTTYF